MSLLGGIGLEPAPANPDEAGVASVDEGQVPSVPVAAAPEVPEAPEADEPIEIPEGADNPDAVKRLIQAERKVARDANARARRLEQEAVEAAEASKPLEERLANAERKAQEAELNALRIEVGSGLGLSLTLSKRLTGTTAEELAQDATTLIAELGTKPKPQLPGLDGGVKTPPPTDVDPSKRHDNWLAEAINAKRHGA